MSSRANDLYIATSEIPELWDGELIAWRAPVVTPNGTRVQYRFKAELSESQAIKLLIYNNIIRVASMNVDVGNRPSVVGYGAEGDRTLDLRIANATLSQLSYRPTDGHPRNQAFSERPATTPRAGPPAVGAGF